MRHGPMRLIARAENRIAAHQQAPRFLVVGLGHRMDAVNVTRAWMSIVPGSIGVCAALSAAPAIIRIIGRGGLTAISRASSTRSTRSTLRPAPDAAASARRARVGDREAQRFALRRVAILQVEPDAADRGRARLHDRVENFTRARRCHRGGLRCRCARRTHAARACPARSRTPAGGRSRSSARPRARGAACARRCCTAVIASALRRCASRGLLARVSTADGDERAIRRTADRRFADGHDDVVLRRRRLLRGGGAGQGDPENSYEPHTILNPMLCA